MVKKKNKIVSQYIQDRGFTAILQPVSTELKFAVTVQRMVTSFIYRYYSQLRQQPSPAPSDNSHSQHCQNKRTFPSDQDDGWMQTGQDSPKSLASTVHHFQLFCMPQSGQLHTLKTEFELPRFIVQVFLPVVPDLASFLKTGLSPIRVRGQTQAYEQAPSHSKTLQNPLRWVLPFTGL